MKAPKGRQDELVLGVTANMCAGGSVLSQRLRASNARGSTASRGVIGLEFNGFGQTLKPKHRYRCTFCTLIQSDTPLFCADFIRGWRRCYCYWCWLAVPLLPHLLLQLVYTSPAGSSPAAGDLTAASCRKCLLLFRAVAYAVRVILFGVISTLFVAWFSLRYFV